MNRSNETRLRKLESETAGDAGLALIAFGPGETAEEATARFFTRRPQEGRSFARSVSTRAFKARARASVGARASYRAQRASASSIPISCRPRRAYPALRSTKMGVTKAYRVDMEFTTAPSMRQVSQ
jgi:hypothetical protein